jgi:hypothetical protein
LASLVLRLYQSVRISTQELAGMSPCVFSQAFTPSTVSRKSLFFVASAEQSMTQAGPTKFLTGIVSVVLFGWSLPLIQCTGASKCVPECSPSFSQFHAQNGPSLS